MEKAENLWRGVVEHLPDGDRQYIRSLDDIGFFIMPYVDEFGANISLRWRARRWLKQRLREIYG